MEVIIATNFLWLNQKEMQKCIYYFFVAGETCVHVAAIHGNIEVLRHLIWYGANVNAREGCGG